MHRSRAYRVLALTLALALSLSAPAFAVTQSDLESSQDKAAAHRRLAKVAEERAERLRAEAKALDQRIEGLEAEVSALNPKIEQAAARTAHLRAEVTRLRRAIQAKQAELDRTIAEYEEQRALLKRRAETTYKQGDWYYFEMLLGSQDMGDLIARTELVARVIESNQRLADSLADSRDRLEQVREELDHTLHDVAAKRAEAEKVERDLRELRERRQAVVNEQQYIYEKKTELVAENKANAERLRALAEEEEEEARRIAALLAARAKGSGRYDGVMAWPVPASTRITSPYGWRICPFHGKELHPGIDIGAPQGSAIVAAGDGEVIYAGYRGGYGNTVMIDHGEGVVTLYAHQAPGAIAVGAGQRVSKGQQIGAVGSTGFSTGPHLHFEVRVNGAAQNPMSYLD